MFVEAGEAATAVRAQFAANASAARALGERLRRSPPSVILTCGRGSSDHAATYAKYLFETRVGVLTAFRRTCAIGLIAGIVVSLGYMAGTAILTPDLWIEPLGALVKTGPAIVLMLVALLMLDNR